MVFQGWFNGLRCGLGVSCQGQNVSSADLSAGQRGGNLIQRKGGEERPLHAQETSWRERVGVISRTKRRRDLGSEKKLKAEKSGIPIGVVEEELSWSRKGV